MPEELPAEAHEKPASSQYAKLICYVTALMILGMIVIDRDSAGKLAMRDELVQREFHAERMMERAIQLEKRSTLPLVNICYQGLAGTGPRCAIEESEGTLMLTYPDQVPVGLLGNYKIDYRTPLPNNRWNLPEAEVLASLNDLVKQLAPLIAQRKQKEISDALGRQANEFIEQAV